MDENTMNFMAWLQSRGCIVTVIQTLEEGGDYYVMKVETPEGGTYEVTEMLTK